MQFCSLRQSMHRSFLRCNVLDRCTPVWSASPRHFVARCNAVVARRCSNLNSTARFPLNERWRSLTAHHFCCCVDCMLVRETKRDYYTHHNTSAHTTHKALIKCTATAFFNASKVTTNSAQLWSECVVACVKAGCVAKWFDRIV